MTDQETMQAEDQLEEQGLEELSEEDLENVAGGWSGDDDGSGGG